MTTNFFQRWINSVRKARNQKSTRAGFRPLFEILEEREVMSAPTTVDLSTYVRVGRFDLPEPTRTTPPANSLLSSEASAVTYNWDTDTLFLVGDGGTSVLQISKTGQLIDSMTLAPGGSPQGTDFYDTEGVTYVGGGKFVLIEERDRQANLFTYVAGGTLHRSDVQTVKLGTTIGNVGLEGISYDPLTGGFIAVKEKDPESIFQTGIDFNAGTATNGSPTATSSSNLFNPVLASLADFSDVFALSNLPSLSGYAEYGNLLVLSQESGQIINIDRSGNVSSRLTIVADLGSPLSVPDMTMEGITMDRDGFLYVVNENGGGDANHPQLWVYAHSDAPNLAPTGIALNNAVSSIPENTSTAAPVKVADIAVADDGLGVNNLTVTGTDATSFQIIGAALYLRAGTPLNATSKPNYDVTVNVDDATVGGSPDASMTYSLTVTPVVGGTATLIISEVAPWSSGNSPAALGVDWFEVTNIGNATAIITGWKMDDSGPNIATAVALNGITSIAPGESVIFMETSNANLPTKRAAFLNLWFGASPPANLQIGNYTGSGVGLSTGGDAVNLFDTTSTVRASVTFGNSPAGPSFPTFDNAASFNGTTISTLSAIGVNGAFVAANDTNEIGSPGTIGPAPTPVVTIVATDASAAETGTDPGVFRITRTGSTVGPLTVHYTITNGVGQANSADYTPTLSGVATVPSGQSYVDITITPVDDALVEGAETLTLTIGDTGSYDAGSPASATITFSDNDNTAPVASANPASFHIDEDANTAQTITLSGTDVETDAANLTFTITQGPLHGILKHGSDILTPGSTFTGSPADVTYQPTEANYNGPDSFKFKVTDTGNPVGTPDNVHDSDEVTISITVDPVNNAPVLTVPGMQTTVEDVAVTVHGIAVADGDVTEGTGVTNVTLSVSSGRVTVPTGIVGGLSAAQIAGNGTDSVVLQGPIAAVNATLAAGLTYLGYLNFHGGDTLTVVANDLGNTGAGGARIDAKLVSIQVMSPTQQITQLQAMLVALESQGALSHRLTRLLVKELDLAELAVNKNKTKVAFGVITAFKIEIHLLVLVRALTPTQANPVLTATDLLLKSLRIGGGF